MDSVLGPWIRDEFGLYQCHICDDNSPKKALLDIKEAGIMEKDILICENCCRILGQHFDCLVKSLVETMRIQQQEMGLAN